MSETQRNILIMTADAGFGHRSAAIALAAALRDKYGAACQVDVINPLDDRRTPFFLRDSQSDYDRVINNLPELYRLGYDFSDLAVPGVLVESALTVLLYEVMRDTIKEYNPDAVILTYPLYQPPLTALKTISNLSIPILTVITDLVSVHRLWFDSHVDTCIVPTTVSRQLALEYGLPADMIHLAGIPVHPDIAKEQRDPHQIRRELGWDPDLPTFLAIGSRRVSGLMDILHVFNHYGKPLQLVLSAGKDPELYAQMQANDWHVPVHIYEYVQNMPVFMRAADVIIGKAGGLTVTESLASGRPILLVDVLPGQELGNAGYVVQNQAGDLIENPIDMLETLHHWMKDERSLMRYRAEQARKLGKPQAAYEIADLAWSAAGVEQHPGGSLVQLRTNMIDLLDRNKILWQTSLKKIGKNSPKP